MFALKVLLLTGITWTTEGVLKFTQTPKAVVYRLEGNNATLRWEYSADDKAAELKLISLKLYNKTQDAFPLALVVEYANGNVVVNPRIPALYRGRVEKIENATFVIKNLIFQHSNLYKCSLEANSGHQSKESIVQLVVTGQASVDRPLHFAVMGDSVTFTCNATNVPSQNFTWRRHRETQEITNDAHHSVVSVTGSSQLTIKNVTASDEEYYVCDATVDADQPNFATAFLQLPKDVAEVKGDAPCPKRSFTVNRNEKEIICCPVIGYPPPIVTWEKNGIQLQKRKDIYLPITPVKDDDFGSYTCTVTNLKTSKIIGPFTITVMEESAILDELPESRDGTDRKAAMVKWEPPAWADYFVVKMTGNGIRDDLVYTGRQTSLELPYDSFVKDQADEMPEKIAVRAVVTVINDTRCAKMKPVYPTIVKPADNVN